MRLTKEKEKVKNVIRDSSQKHVILQNKDTSSALPWKVVQRVGVALINSVNKQ